MDRARNFFVETAMGTKMNLQSGKNSDYVRSVKETCRIAIERVLSPLRFFDSTFWLCRDFYRQKKELKVLHDFTHNVINSKKNNKSIDKNTKRPAFLDLLLKFSQDENILSTEEIREEVDTFMFAVSKNGFWVLKTLVIFRDMTQQPLAFVSRCTVWLIIPKFK